MKVTVKYENHNESHLKHTRVQQVKSLTITNASKEVDAWEFSDIAVRGVN